MHQILAKSLAQPLGPIQVADVVMDLSIYFMDSFDIPSIFALAKNLVGIFRRVFYLRLWFEGRCEIVSF